MRYLSTLAFFISFTFHIYGQTGVIKGRVTNIINKEPIPFSNIIIEGTTSGATTDIDGNYQIINLKPGSYNIKVSTVGFKSLTNFEVQVNNAKATFSNF